LRKRRESGIRLSGLVLEDLLCFAERYNWNSQQTKEVVEHFKKCVQLPKGHKLPSKFSLLVLISPVLNH